jgi:hypothetical protein
MDDYKKLLASNGLTMISVGADFDKLDKDPQSVVENARPLAQIRGLLLDSHDGTNFTIDDTKRAVEVFSRAGKLLRENGFSFCYHMHG